MEAEITGGLEHPGIIPIYGLNHYDDGRPFYAMRLIKGDSLKQAINNFHTSEGPGRDPSERSLGFRKLLVRFLDACNAVAYAHSRGVLHRDLKPSNIMLGPYGETLVFDWGLAKVIGRPEGAAGAEGTLRPASAGGSHETIPGSALGTPAYMSPEQAAGDLDQLGPASDIYSLGATLYCLLTGQAPFTDPDGLVVQQKVVRGDFVPPRQVRPEVSPALEAICLKAMAKSPAQRYAQVAELVEDVQRWIADEPVSVYRDPPITRLLRWGRWHKPVLTGLAVLLVSAIPGLTLTTVLVNGEKARKEEQRKLAVANAAQAQENFRLAYEAADGMLTEVGDVELGDVPQMEPVRKRLLDKARRSYQKFLVQKSNDSAVRWGAGRASSRLGNVLEMMGEYADAEALLSSGDRSPQALDPGIAGQRRLSPRPGPHLSWFGHAVEEVESISGVGEQLR